MRLMALLGLAFAAALAASSCSSSGSGHTMSTPTPTGPTTIRMLFSNGLGNLGANSVSPNPAPVSPGAMVTWQNNDSTAHHIAFDDGSLDAGIIAPGATSPAKALSESAGRYRCVIHPRMIGSINLATNPSPAPGPGS